MDLDLLFRALSDSTRRRIMDELAGRDGQTLFELHARLIAWHSFDASRQALSKHLAVLEEAGLLRSAWRWRSKHHFLVREPIRQAWRLWLRGFIEDRETHKEAAGENNSNERAGR